MLHKITKWTRTLDFDTYCICKNASNNAHTEIYSLVFVGSKSSGKSLYMPGADPGFLVRGFIYIKVWGFPLIILSYFS